MHSTSGLNNGDEPVFVVLGDPNDPHIHSVLSNIPKIKLRCTVIDHLGDNALKILVDKSANASLSINGYNIWPALIWCRTKLRPPKIIRNEDDANRQLIYEEWVALYRDICAIFSSIVINSRYGAADCAYKLNQVKVAKELGFNVPETIVTNCKRQALHFLKNEKNCVMKKLMSGPYAYLNSGSNIFSAKMIPTQNVAYNDIKNADKQDLRNCPLFIQKKIHKLYDIRCVVIGKDVYAFGIDSQKFHLSETDWRLAAFYLNYNKITIPSEIKNKMANFLKKYNLFYGVFDLAIDEKRRYWFFECNPDGQWHWLDEVSGGEIGRAFAKKIVSHIYAKRR